MKERTIRECMAKMTRKQVTSMAFRLNLDPPPRRARDLLVWRDELAEQLPDMGARVRECLGLAGIKKLRVCLEQRDGVWMAHRSLVAAKEAERTFATLKMLALAWSDRQNWYVQGCLMKMLIVPHGEKRLLDASDDLEKVMRGYLLHFGMLRAEELQKMIINRDDAETVNVLLAVWARRRGLEGVLMAENEVWLMSDRLQEPDELYKQVNRPDRRLLPYAKVTEDQARGAEKLGVTGDPELVTRLLELGKRVRSAPQRMLLLIAAGETAYNVDDRQQAATAMCLDFEGTRYAQLGEMLVNRYLNTVPVWYVKGHTMAEARQEDRTAAKWNEPCPCGSGRKYGQCCGNFQ